MYQRYQRVTSLIQEELNKIILREMEFDGALVTVTEVQVQKDLDYANVLVSVIPNERSEDVVEKLSKNAKYLEHLLFKKINIRPMPVIRFTLDKGLSNAAEIEKRFLEIEEQNKQEIEKQEKGE